MLDSLNRRSFLGAAAVSGMLTGRVTGAPAIPSADRDTAKPSKPFLTDANDFVDVSRGSPKPFNIKGEALVQARLTPKDWRLEIIGDDSATVAHPKRLEDNTALDLAALMELGKTRGVKYLKAMQCNNIPSPLGQGLWEGVSLHEVLATLGNLENVRRVYYWGFHNDDPAQLFQSSLSYNQAMETPPWQPPPLLAYRLNGQEIPLLRGGPVRLIVPWAHGFKSIKWLQRIILTNDHRANDTYAEQNNDPESALKTAAYLGRETLTFPANEAFQVDGVAIAGGSGIKRVEYWVRPATGGDTKLADDDPAWKTAVWRPCEIMPPPSDWEAILPAGTSSKEVWGFDPTTGKPKDWPLPYSSVGWSARVDALAPGSYELRARTVDRNGFAQPQPRPYQKAGMNLIPCRILDVTA